MHYEREDGFSFDLPDGWRRDEHNLMLTFYGPSGDPGHNSEVIQIMIGDILPRYFSPAAREQFLAEPGAETLRSRVGDEDNVVVLKKSRESEISVVRDGIQYTISHGHDAITDAAIELLKATAQFPSRKGPTPAAAAGTPASRDLRVPQLRRAYTLPEKPLNPYTPAEMSQRVPQLNGRNLFIDFQKDIDGPQTAVKLVRGELGKHGVRWIEDPAPAEAIIWVQGAGQRLRFAFVVAHYRDRNRYIAAECGPRELTSTIMTGICEYFRLGQGNTASEDPVTRVVELNRAITGSTIARDWPRARQLIGELAVVIPGLEKSREPTAIKHVVDALADAAASYAGTQFPESLALREAAHATLVKIGREAIPLLREGLSHSDPEIRHHCGLALRSIKKSAKRSRGWWRFWKA
jgi:hypothetical protein